MHRSRDLYIYPPGLVPSEHYSFKIRKKDRMNGLNHLHSLQHVNLGATNGVTANAYYWRLDK